MTDIFLKFSCLGDNSLRNPSRGNLASVEGKDAAVRNTMKKWGSRIVGKLRELGPYMAIELILPGGSLIALALWLYNRNHAKAPA